MRIILSNTSQEALYEQIVRQVKASIVRGELAAGGALPSIRSLARDLEISVITTKRAYEELEREGFIETQPGKGSFVSVKNQEFLREKRYQEFEQQIKTAISLARELTISPIELVELINLFYEEENTHESHTGNQ